MPPKMALLAWNDDMSADDPAAQLLTSRYVC